MMLHCLKILKDMSTLTSSTPLDLWTLNLDYEIDTVYFS
jgi:hypothetical protein